MSDEPSSRIDKPWGCFVILEETKATKVKSLIVNPGHRLSLQTHEHRDEHWVIVRGVARVTLGDVTTDYHYGDHVYVRRGTRHRIACTGPEPVEIIEIQTGNSFHEEDIVRYSDDYHRADKVV